MRHTELFLIVFLITILFFRVDIEEWIRDRYVEQHEVIVKPRIDSDSIRWWQHFDSVRWDKPKSKIKTIQDER